MPTMFGNPGPVPATRGIPYNPDTPPLNRNPMDDEFDRGLLDGKWTLMEDTGGNYAVSFSGSLCNLKLNTTSTTTYRYLVLRQPAPSGAFKVRAKFISGSHYNFIGTILSPLVISSGKWVMNGVMSHSSVSDRLTSVIGRYTNSTYNANDNEWLRVNSQVYYQELECDGTNMFFRLSMDGIFYEEFWTEPYATHLGAAPDAIMCGMHPYQNLSAIYKPHISIDWFRRVA